MGRLATQRRKPPAGTTARGVLGLAFAGGVRRPASLRASPPARRLPAERYSRPTSSSAAREAPDPGARAVLLTTRRARPARLAVLRHPTTLVRRGGRAGGRVGAAHVHAGHRTVVAARPSLRHRGALPEAGLVSCRPALGGELRDRLERCRGIRLPNLVAAARADEVGDGRIELTGALRSPVVPPPIAAASRARTDLLAVRPQVERADRRQRPRRHRSLLPLAPT